MAPVTQMTPAELKALMDQGSTYCLLDVREPWEVAIAAIRGSVYIPLNEIPGRLQELDAGQAVIVMCKAGGRSQRVADYLAARGFAQVSNLQGGIDAWSRDIEPDLPAY